MPTQEQETLEYPHLIVRARPSVYVRWKVEFVEKTEIILANGKFTPPFPNAFHEGVLKKEALDLAIEALITITRESGYRMCFVLSPTKCFYVEPDGRVEESSEPPSGGLQIDGTKKG
ncbi:MAG: hypothetical protein EBQ92_12860 [Proteobacteria bacterium]|nr:hypothetical protein [Pseudomonadota bacterium]